MRGRSRRSQLAMLALAWPLLACDPPELSDAGQYRLDIDIVDRTGRNGHHVLIGSEFQVVIRELADGGEVDPDGGGLGCVPASSTGVVSELGGRRYRVDAAGPGAVEFAAPIDACPANDDALVELGPDRWSVTGVDPADAVGRWVAPGDASALIWGTSPGPAAVWPPGFGRALATAQVVGGGQFMLTPALFERDALAQDEEAEAEVRWSDPDAVVTVPAHYAELARDHDETGEVHDIDYLHGSLASGETVEVRATILAHEFTLPEVRAVPVEHIVSLDLVPVYWPSEAPEREWGPPVGIVAITRDALGQRVIGAPVTWEVTRGRLATLAEDDYGEVVEIADCRDEPKRPQWRGATVEATLGDLVAVTELEWVALPSDSIDPSSEMCNASACECSARDDAGGASGLASLALLGLAGLLRARRRQPSKRSSASASAST